MPRFHAGFSVGTVLGALTGAGAAAVGLPVEAQLAATAVAVWVGVWLCVQAFLPVVVHAQDAPAGLPLSRAWREPRTLLIGLLVLCFAFTEGTANDWLAVALVDGHGTSEAVGALGFACFVSSMTVCRAVAGSLLSRFGRPLVLRTSAALGWPACCWWCSARRCRWCSPVRCYGEPVRSLGFPVGMSAAADDPHGAAVRVSVVSSIGYTAFLAGPPLIGLLAEPDRWGF
jgi:cyanate permease